MINNKENINKQILQKVRKLPEHRCKFCNRLLFLGNVQYVEIKCPKCSQIAKIGKRINEIYIKNRIA